MTRTLLIALFFALMTTFSMGCSSVMQPIDLRTDVVEGSGLKGLAESFYRADTTEEMERLVREALALNPQAALSNELAAVLAQLMDRPTEQFTHLVIALRDARNSSAALHLRMLNRLQTGERERAVLLPLLERLSDNHPDGHIRTYAQRLLSQRLYRAGEYDAGVEWLDRAGHAPAFALVGPWDNDQGKALDTALDPETGFEIGETYRGVVTQSAWQTSHVGTHLDEVDFLERIRPDEWVTAYLASNIIASDSAEVSLNMGTSDPIKVWLNGTLVLEAREADRHRIDQFAIPVQLEKGNNHLLVKTAHQEGAWKFSARFTNLDQGLPIELSSELPKSGPACQSGKAEWTPKTLAENWTSHLIEAPARRAYHTNFWLKEMGAKRERVHHLESALSTFDSGVVLDYEYAMSLWNIYEAGRTSNQLEKIHRMAKGSIPALFAKRGRFFRQRKRFDKARDILLEGQKAYPEAETILLELERLYSEERWYQDASKVMRQLQEMHPGVITYLKRLRTLLETEGKVMEAQTVEEELLDMYEGDWSTLASAFLRHLAKNQIGAAEEIVDVMQEYHGARASTWRYTAQLERRRGDTAAALEALQKGMERSPYDSIFPKEVGRLLYDDDKKEQAISAWEHALELDPDDERLAHRLQFLQEGEKEAWQEDIPTLETLFSLLTQPVETTPGANLHVHLDHEVTRLYADGTTANVRTFVAEALNEAGRDRLTLNKLSGAGRKRVLHAVAVTSDGNQLEASAIRGNTVRFRGLDVGSKIILQYREDAAPRGYLSKYMVRQWWFQSGPASVAESQWVLWLPGETTLHVDKVGENILETRRNEENLLRYAWTQQDVQPVIPETLMPSVSELGNKVRVSTVPAWAFFVEWEKALLEDAFRSSPQVTALALKLTDGETDRVKAVHMLHQYVMQKIRYQQDYETMIAGVKPHAAPTVLERKYGDCKDKTVLFTELARALGVQVHFALIRTRPRGPVAVNIPSQQFNHVVPYVPAQEGIDQGFFLDPTADALDIHSMRHDDVGTLSLVYDPSDSSFEWREVPYQDSSANYVKMEFDMRVNRNGNAEGTIQVSAVGQSGSRLRVASRNREQLKRVIEGLSGLFISGVRVKETTVIEAEDLYRPALFDVKFEKGAHFREDGKYLRAPVPHGWKPGNFFQMEKRLYPLVLGVPSEERTRVSYTLDKGVSVKSTPKEIRMESKCLVFKRTVKRKGKTIVVEDLLKTLCERILPEDYATHRAFVLELGNVRRDEVVLQKR